MGGAITGDSLNRLLKEGLQVLNTCVKAILAIGLISESCAKGQGIAAVPGIVNQRVDDPMHTCRTVDVLYQLTFLSDSSGLAHACFVRKVAPDRLGACHSKSSSFGALFQHPFRGKSHLQHSRSLHDVTFLPILVG